MDLEADIAIVGAGPAGASAATLLARAGRRVVLIDRKCFPREKVCGGCLSGRTVARLRDLLGRDSALPGTAGERVTFTIGTYRLTCRPNGGTRVVHRSELDSRLVQEALQEGAAGLFGEPASLILERNSGAPRVVRTVEVGGRIVHAGTVLVAAGVGALASRLGMAGKRTRPRMLAQQWVQPAGPGLPEPGAVELHWLHGGYVGLASPCAGDCVVALAARIGEGREESAFDRLRALNPRAALWQVLPADAPKRYAARGAAGFPWTPRRLGAGNALLIGDAAGYEEPYTGEGIGLALLSAGCATDAILAGGDILGRYRDLMRRYHQPVVRRTAWISRWLHCPAVMWLASRRPVLPGSLLARWVERVHVEGWR
jgi:menaquinone-9 beta-reductase